MSDENKIRDAADAVKGIVEAVPVYQDVAQPAAKEIGTALQTVAKAIHIALAPISALVWGYEKIAEYLDKTLTEKLKGVPAERIVTPSPAVAGPTVEALRFTAYEPSLRELYANLLATAIDKKTAVDSHPAFVEIIRQLTPNEAHLLSFMASNPCPDFPILSGNVMVWAKEINMRHRTDFRHFCTLGEEAGLQDSDLIDSYIDNFLRLGLITIDRLDENDNVAEIMPYHHPYDYLETQAIELTKLRLVQRHEYYVNQFKDLEEFKQDKELENWTISPGEVELNLIREVLSFTSFGARFYQACIKADTHS